ncbi:hypothetical protein E0Z06_09770 [Rheinheimera sp. D18]|uniref:hypothetical protein n=1 Tax=Rheinheimera sp. D18 TaxID=2545632 RepID=UPI00104CE2A4|nr:hypothetical protein [Rheinheimera sp. D18]QBL09783.1 hypothetical protein E0Z06_09770 [Rheinheimera sp. D18]
MSLSSFRQPYVIALLLLLTLIFYIDFSSRLYAPMRQSNQALIATDLQQWQSSLATPVPAGRLQAFIHPADKKTADSAALADTTKPIVALPGSEVFGDSRLRLRAVFIRQHAGENTRLALIEQQLLAGDSAGKVVAHLLQPGASLGQFLITEIQTERVALSVDSDDSRLLPLFTAADNAKPEAAGPGKPGDTPADKLLSVLDSANEQDAEDLKALLELMKKQQ